MSIAKSVDIIEVGPRDGLQNESQALSVDLKVWLINSLAKSGLRIIEAGSFVSPKWVPQMADSGAVFSRLDRQSTIRYPALVPNTTGLEHALQAGVKEIACFTSASEAFNQKNTNCSLTESLKRIAEVVKHAQQQGLPVRAYLSCIAGCPYQGEVDKHAVLDVAKQLLEMGCYEISLGDTIGVGTPATVGALLELLTEHLPTDQLALHFHDTYGQALANIYIGLLMGINKIDSSVAGLGGCPYAKGATGNVATEDLVYMLHGMGIHTGVDLPQLVKVGQQISQFLNRPNQSKVGNAMQTRANKK